LLVRFKQMIITIELQSTEYRYSQQYRRRYLDDDDE
jgi:hypothetical protein